MNTPSLKEIFKKFGFFREYAALIAPLALALVAGLLFIPTILMIGKLTAEVEAKSIGELGRPAEIILSKPVVPAGQWEIEKVYQDAYQKEADQIANMVETTSKRELLSYNIFPDTNETSVSIYNRFGENYRSGIYTMLKELSARDCPTAAELESAGLNARTATTTRNRNQGNETKQLIKEALCNEIAKTTSVYINPDTIPGYDFWSDFPYQNKSDSIEQCWYWQLGYWMIEDVINTVQQVNGGSSSIFDSPVKRIVSISFGKSSSGTTSAGQRTTTTSTSTRPSYVIGFKDVSTPLTARKTTKEYGVVHFSIIAVVDIENVPFFISTLCSAKEHKFRGFSGDQPSQAYQHNQISVLQIDFGLFERKEGEHELYRYGNDSVVEIELLCEYIFNTEGYEEIMPQSVKDFLARNVL